MTALGRRASPKTGPERANALALLRLQGQTLKIEARAKERLADEYDAAQERGEIGRHGGNRQVSNPETCKATETLTPRDIHEARSIRDAERADPGAIERSLEARVAQGEAPTRAAGCFLTRRA